jgi:hypothetical protein
MATIVLPIVMMDQPMTILAVWPAWSAPRYCRLIDGVLNERLSQAASTSWFALSTLYA